MHAQVLALAAGLSARAQGTPAGAEFQANTYTTGSQTIPAVASASSGDFVVVWASAYQDGSDFGILAQRFASSGARLGSEFRVNTYTTGYQGLPAVSSDPSGRFVVVWQSQDGSLNGVFGQRFSSSGARLGGEFQISTYTTSNQVDPVAASDPLGNFVVVWDSYKQDGSGTGVFGQRYASNGSRLGAEFRVNSYTTFSQEEPAVSSDSSGNFVVVWQSYGPDGARIGVFGQRYASSGSRLGAEFQINTYTTNDQQGPRVSSDPSGGFVVAWSSLQQDGQGEGIFGQRYASGGSRLGAEFRVNTSTTDRQTVPSVSSDSSGNFVVVWESAAQDGDDGGIFGQRYASNGSRLGTEFRVNTYTTSLQFDPIVSTDARGAFVVVWGGYDQDTSGSGVFGQRFGRILPALNFFTLAPCRVVDTRNAAGPFGGPALLPSATRNFDVALASCGVPGTALAVSVNVAVTQPAQPGYLTLWQQGAAQPLASSINFGAGQTRTNNAVVPVAANGSATISVFSGTPGTVHLILDVNGYFQ